MHSESRDDDDDDDELVREREMTATRTRYQQVTLQVCEDLGSSFRRRGEAWWKERLLTFKEEYKGA